MKRLQQKCFVASAGFHSLLLVILLIGPAFLAPKSKPDNRPPLDVIPSKLIDGIFSGGGRPDGSPPAYAPPVPPAPPVQKPAPQPEPVKERAPQPPPEPIRSQAPDPNALEQKPDRKSRLPDVPTKLVVRPKQTSKDTSTSTTPSAEEVEARKVAERNARFADAVGASVRALRSDLKPGLSKDPIGPGGGGEVYGPYDDAVRSIYWHAWVAPTDTEADTAVVLATVTIASDGNVLSAHITKPCGDASVNRSIQRALDSVTYIAPFPAGAKDKQRTYPLKFDLKAKRLS
jgi:TonB family protein